MVRLAEDEENETQAFIDYANTGSNYRLLLARLEDPKLDGAGLQDQDEGGILVEGLGKTGFDISNKPEQWRRGYYEVLMGAARAAEHLDDCLLDPARKTVFPKAVVPGSSNPNPRPIPPGAALPPREEDCVPAFEAPEVFYMRILTTQGLTEKQRVDAALAFGTWLDFKGSPNTALEMYKWALDIATSNSPSSKPVVDAASGVLNPNAGPPSANMLSVSTALAVHHALTSNLSTALPIFLSVLRARRTLPDPPPDTESGPPANDEGGIVKAIVSMTKDVFVAPPYPPPPPDGTTPPYRSPKELCEEAGVMTNIGEILYASKSSKTSKEDGLAWTREAVDIAEEQLRTRRLSKEGSKTCKQCLGVAIGNWERMVANLASEEKEARKSQGAKVGGWLGFGGEEQKDMVGRWESEEMVVKERRRRASELLEVIPKAPKAFSFLSV